MDQNDREEILHELQLSVSKLHQEVEQANKKSADDFWNSLSYDQKCDAFHAVVQRLVEGEIEKQGSYRHVLYNVFGFGEEMYGRGIDCGYIKLHNSIVTRTDLQEHNDLRPVVEKPHE